MISLSCCWLEERLNRRARWAFITFLEKGTASEYLFSMYQEIAAEFQGDEQEESTQADAEVVEGEAEVEQAETETSAGDSEVPAGEEDRDPTPVSCNPYLLLKPQHFFYLHRNFLRLP
jgi:hypothetical protein